MVDKAHVLALSTALQMKSSETELACAEPGLTAPQAYGFRSDNHVWCCGVTGFNTRLASIEA